MIRLFSRKSRAPSLPESGADSPADVRGNGHKPSAPLRDVLEQNLEAGRYGIIMNHSELAAHPKAHHLRQRAEQAVDEQFCMVPEGYASIPQSLNDEPGCAEQDYDTPSFLLARCAITHAQFQNFVDDGGYRDIELWPEDIRPHLINFTDSTNQPGPRFWKNGRHDPQLANHPVVGVCYFEAAAFAAWAGFRLPTEPEWQMAASWRIRSAANSVRRYPWGDAVDLRRCNIWAAGHKRTLPADALPESAAPNGVLQLIGNVWEWTSSDFICLDHEGRTIIGQMLMKSIRGGAFDTYFPWQATSLFRTASDCLVRMHNVGFRCAMDEPAAQDPATDADVV